MKPTYFLPLAAGFLLLQAGCNSPANETQTDNASELAASDIPTVVVPPAPLPNPGIPGYRFPEDSATIERWVQQRDSAAIDQHGWGLWASLTTPVKVTKGDTLRVYQTWTTKQELGDSLRKQQATRKVGADFTRQSRPLVRHLEHPRQFLRDDRLRHLLRSHTPSFADSVVESVSYDPTAAQTIFNRKLFLTATLTSMLQRGRQAIPDFPHQSVAVKPVYEIIPGPRREGYQRKHLYRMKVWANLPDSLQTKPGSFGQEKWTSWVYVDSHNQGKGHGAVAHQGQGYSPEVTYNVNDFVHYTLTAREAFVLDSTKQVVGARGGDIAVLVAMHITSREIQRWTWQTVWWAPNPRQAPAPTRPSVLAARPAQLKGSPRHYALAIAYQMLDPAQPLNGGNNRGHSIYVFNPYLEAAFGAFDKVHPAQVQDGNVLVTNNVGIRSNCMSCHIQANFAPANDSTGPSYIGNTYISYDSTEFKGVLKTDFLWSVADMATPPKSAPAASAAPPAATLHVQRSKRK